MHPEYPIECTCSHRRERFQLAFARNAIELLPQREDASYVSSPQGLVVLAETEAALERPVRILRETYGDEVCIGEPKVRYRQGATLEEPYMGVRVLCAPRHFRAVRMDLEARGAEILDAEETDQFGIVRATAPLAVLLGYSCRLAELTAGRAQHTMWLSHYAPVTSRPPGGDAA